MRFPLLEVPQYHIHHVFYGFRLGSGSLVEARFSEKVRENLVMWVSRVSCGGDSLDLWYTRAWN